MKKTLVIIILGPILFYLSIVAFKSNLFKKIVNRSNLECIKIDGVHGPEDIVPVGDGILISSSHLREMENGWVQGGIFHYNPQTKSLVNMTKTFEGKLNIHGMASVETKDNLWKVVAVNHREKSDQILEFEYSSGKLVLKNETSSEGLFNLNDIEFVGPKNETFIVSHDHASKNESIKLLENFFRFGFSKLSLFDGHSATYLTDGLTFANGVTRLNDKELAVADMLNKRIIFYNTEKLENISIKKVVKLDFFPDNLSLSISGEKLYIAGHYKILKLKSHAKDPKSNISPSAINTLDLKTGELTNIFSNDGKYLSGSSVAQEFGERLYIGNVYQDYFLECKND